MRYDCCSFDNEKLPKLCKRNNFPISYGKFRIELFVRFNSRKVIRSPINQNMTTCQISKNDDVVGKAPILDEKVSSTLLFYLPISEGRFRNLLFDKSSVTR
jgi:hypothetical protein